MYKMNSKIKEQLKKDIKLALVGMLVFVLATIGFFLALFIWGFVVTCPK